MTKSPVANGGDGVGNNDLREITGEKCVFTDRFQAIWQNHRHPPKTEDSEAKCIRTDFFQRARECDGINTTHVESKVPHNGDSFGDGYRIEPTALKGSFAG